MCSLRPTSPFLLAPCLLVLACDPLDDGTGDTGGMDAAGDDDVGPADGGDDTVGDGDDGGGGGDPFGATVAHNAVRAAAQPTPDPALPDLVWDPDLAAVALAWAQGCVFQHSDGPYGENLYAGTGTPTVLDAIDAWAAEAAQYDYESNACSGVCGHYTQIVWRDTARVGCGFADCDPLQGAGFAGRYWVCNYDPPGNFVGEKPY